VRDAALFLFRRSLRNRMRGLSARMRSPRYVFALLLGLGYLSLVLFGQHQGNSAGLPSPAITLGGSLFLLLLVLKWWVLGADRTALAFTPAEIHFFFPAPVSRAALLQYKLLWAQPLILVNVLVWTFLLRRGEGHPLGAVFYASSLWILFDILFLHRLGVALTRDSTTAHGAAGLRRSWPALLLVTAVAVAAWITIHRLPDGSWSGQPNGLPGAIGRLLETAPFRYVVWPFRMPLDPLAATTVQEWLRSAAAALVVLGLHLVWVIRADRAFEEAALEASARRAARLDRWRKQGAGASMAPRRTRYWVGLSPSGHPIAAIVWKNVTRLVRTLSPSFIVMIAVIAGVSMAVVLIEGQEDPALLRVFGTMALTWVVVLSVLGPQWVRIDLRGELEQLSLLRTWPLSGMAVMAGQVLSSALVLTLLQLVLGAIALLGLWSDATTLLTAGQLTAALAPACLVLVTLNVVALCIQNGGALLYPAWVRTEIRPGGIEQVGQHLLTAGVSFLLLAVAALGPALAASGVTYLLWARLEAWALVPALLLAGAALALESFLILDWLGERFERYDPSTA
jgi:ABC-2 type transport system permease protein